MSDTEALQHFNRQRISKEMVLYLSSLTESIVQRVRQRSDCNQRKIPTLYEFIIGLVNNSKVGTSILMSTTVYLNRLKMILPPNIVGIETTRHRIFLGCLIIAAKSLNDNSPMNKHWSQHSNGLLTNKEVNTVERELLSYLRWNVTFTTEELISSLRSFLIPIRYKMHRDMQKTNMLLFNSPGVHSNYNELRSPQYHKGHTQSVDSIPSISSRTSASSASNSVFSYNNREITSSLESISSIEEEQNHLKKSNRQQLTKNGNIYSSNENSHSNYQRRFVSLQSNVDFAYKSVEISSANYNRTNDSINDSDHNGHTNGQDNSSIIRKIRTSSWSSLFHLKA